jgi:hypothetical protein
MVNLTAAALRFCRPFVTGYLDPTDTKFRDLFDRHLSPSYYAACSHRTGDMSAVNSLAGAIVPQQAVVHDLGLGN